MVPARPDPAHARGRRRHGVRAGDHRAPGRAGSGARGRRSEPRAARPQHRDVPGHQRADAPDGRPARVRAGARVRHDDLHAPQEHAGPPLDARDLGADLRDLQDLPDHAGQVHPPARGLHRRDHAVLLRRAAAFQPDEGGHHPAVQPDRHRGQLRRGVVRHPREHLRELAHGVRRAPRQALSDLRDPAEGGHEHRHAAHQRRAVHDAVHPALHPRRLRGAVLHRIRHRRVARRGGAPHRRRHLHQDRRHRRRPDEDRLQHQGGRRAQPGRHRRLHGRQRRRLGRPERRRLRDLRRHRRRADLLHPPGGHRAGDSGPAARVDLRDAHHDDRGQRRILLPERGDREGAVRQRPEDELRGAADAARVAHLDHLGRDDLRRLVPADPDDRRRRLALVEALDDHHLRHAGGRDHPRSGEGLHVDRVRATSGKW